MSFLRLLLLVFIGFGSGVIISGGVFAFIAILGVVPRMAQKTKTEKHIMIYEDCILFGGIYGAITLFFPFHLPIGKMGLIAIGIFSGIFIGSLAVSIAEVLDVIPILTRRVNLKSGITIFMLAIAIGKLIGSLFYFFVPGLSH